MAVDQRKLITVIKQSISNIDLRYPGYHKDLLDFVAQIVFLEREHEQKATQIKNKVDDKVSALGLVIYKKSKDL